MDPRRVLPYLLAVTVCAVLATTALVVVSQRESPPAPSLTAASGEDPGPRAVLADWDERRSIAWAAADTGELADLYVAGSRTGQADVRMLSAYVDRGLRVEGLVTQVLALEVLEQTSDSLRLRVTDRVVGGVVRGEHTTSRLPADRPTTRTLVLRRVGGEWLVASARGQPRATASTSRTSTSWKS